VVLTFYLSLALSSPTILFQTVVYPAKQLSIDNAQHVYDDSGLLASVTLFDDGKLVTLGNNGSSLVAQPDLNMHVLYATHLSDGKVQNFINILRNEGFLDIPESKGGDRYGLICDHLTVNDINHEVCRPADIDHPVLDAIENEITFNMLMSTGSFDSSPHALTPTSVYVRYVQVDGSTCNSPIYLTYDEIEQAYGADWSGERFYHDENVQPFWNAYRERICIYINGPDSVAFAYEVTTKQISVHFDYSIEDPGSDTSDNNDYVHTNITDIMIVVFGVAFGGVIIASIIIRASRKRMGPNQTVQLVDPHNIAMSNAGEAYFTQQPAYYVQETNNGPIYYATNTNVGPNSVIYTVNQ